MPKTFQEQQRERDAFWDATINIFRSRHLIEHLLGWECFGSWEDYQKKYGAQEYALGAGESFATPTPVAFAAKSRDGWEFRVFSPDHEELTCFKPHEVFDDTWQLAQALLAQHKLDSIYQREDFAGWEPRKLLTTLYEAMRMLEHEQKYEAIRKRLGRAEALLEQAAQRILVPNELFDEMHAFLDPPKPS